MLSESVSASCLQPWLTRSIAEPAPLEALRSSERGFSHQGDESETPGVCVCVGRASTGRGASRRW